MSHQVLARKWRPKNFADLVGQEHVTQALSNALDSERIHHAYLLTGTRGVGKTTIARILAKSLNCETGIHASACGQCHACLQIDAGHFIDLLEIDAASNTGVDHIREILEDTQYTPTVGRFKIYIIDEAHMLSKSAFNAMLKTLEEPPEHIKFILATTDPHKLPVTILSRCLCFNLRNMTTAQISQHLQHVLGVEQIAHENRALDFLARAAEGSMRDALSLLDQAIAYNPKMVDEKSVRTMLGSADHHAVAGLLEHLVANDTDSLIKQAESLMIEGVSPSSTLSELALLFQQLALLQIVPNAPIDSDNSALLNQLARQISPEKIQLYYQIAIHGKRDLVLAPDEHAGFIMTLLRMLAFYPLDHNIDPLPALDVNKGVGESKHSSQHISTASVPPASTEIPSTVKPLYDDPKADSVDRSELSDAATSAVSLKNNAAADRPVDNNASVVDSAPTASPNTKKSADSIMSSNTQPLENHKKNQQKACEVLEKDPIIHTLKQEFGAVLDTRTAKLIQN